MDKWGYNYRLSKNIVGKGEIARYEQFLLFPQCFQKLSFIDASKSVSMELILYLPVHLYIIFSFFLSSYNYNIFFICLNSLKAFFRTSLGSLFLCSATQSFL